MYDREILCSIDMVFVNAFEGTFPLVLLHRQILDLTGWHRRGSFSIETWNISDHGFRIVYSIVFGLSNNIYLGQFIFENSSFSSLYSGQVFLEIIGHRSLQFSVIVIASVLFAEVVPISATQASSLLPLFVVNIDEAASAHAYHQLSPFRHYHVHSNYCHPRHLFSFRLLFICVQDWRISYSELSIQRRGSVSRSVSTAVAVWRRKQGEV